MNRTLMESARAMIAYAILPNAYWAKAVVTAVYLKNRSTTSARKEDTTLIQAIVWQKTRSHPLGSVWLCGLCPCTRFRKTKGREIWFVGYCKNSKGYRLFNDTTRTLKKRRDIIFNESAFNFDTVETKQLVSEPRTTEEAITGEQATE